MAARIATLVPEVTNLAIIGDGAWTMRESLRQLYRKRAVPFDVDTEWKNIEADRDSLEHEWLGNPYRWWADIMDVSATTDLLKLEIPILVGFGERDTSVPVESALALKSAFDVEHKTNLTLIVYPGADHQLNAGPISYRPRFFEEVSKALERRLLREDHSGRVWRTLRKHLPGVSLSCATYDASYGGATVSASGWPLSAVSVQRVLAEYERIQVYGARGDIQP